MRNLVYKWWMRLILQNCVHREGDLANSCTARNEDHSTAVAENPVLCFALSMCYKLATWRVRCPVTFQNTNHYPELRLWNFSASFPGVRSCGCTSFDKLLQVTHSARPHRFFLDMEGGSPGKEVGDAQH